MAIAQTEEQLKAMFYKDLERAMNKAALVIYRDLYQRLNRIYSKPEGLYYSRSGELLKAIIPPKAKVDKDGVSVKVGIDVNLITAEDRHNNSFNQHMNIDKTTSWGGIASNIGVLNFYDTGTSNYKLPSVKQTNFWYDVAGDRAFYDNPDYKKLEERMSGLITSELKRKTKIIGGIKT